MLAVDGFSTSIWNKILLGLQFTRASQKWGCYPDATHYFREHTLILLYVLGFWETDLFTFKSQKQRHRYYHNGETSLAAGAIH